MFLLQTVKLQKVFKKYNMVQRKFQIKERKIYSYSKTINIFGINYKNLELNALDKMVLKKNICIFSKHSFSLPF